MKFSDLFDYKGVSHPNFDSIGIEVNQFISIMYKSIENNELLINRENENLNIYYKGEISKAGNDEEWKEDFYHNDYLPKCQELKRFSSTLRGSSIVMCYSFYESKLLKISDVIKSHTKSLRYSEYKFYIKNENSGIKRSDYPNLSSPTFNTHWEMLKKIKEIRNGIAHRDSIILEDKIHEFQYDGIKFIRESQFWDMGYNSSNERKFMIYFDNSNFIKLIVDTTEKFFKEILIAIDDYEAQFKNR